MSSYPLPSENHGRVVRLFFAITTLTLAGVALRYDLGGWWLLVIPVYMTVFFVLTMRAHRRDVRESP